MTTTHNDELRKLIELWIPVHIKDTTHVKEAKIEAREEFIRLIKDYMLAERIDESKHYCDKGHFHDASRDVAMLPSERLVELFHQQKGQR